MCAKVTDKTVLIFLEIITIKLINLIKIIKIKNIKKTLQKYYQVFKHFNDSIQDGLRVKRYKCNKVYWFTSILEILRLLLKIKTLLFCIKIWDFIEI